MELDELITPKEADEGVEIPLYDASGKATDARIKIRSVDSLEYRKAWSRIKRQMFVLSEINKDAKDKLDADELDISNDQQRAASLIVSWTGIEKGGEAWPCTDDNKIAFVRMSSHNTMAILMEAEDRKNFVKKKLPDALKSSSGIGDSISQPETEEESPPPSKQP